MYKISILLYLYLKLNIWNISMPWKKATKKPETKKQSKLEKETLGKGAEVIDLDALNNSLDTVMKDLDNKTGKLKGKPEFDMNFLEVATRLSAAGVKEADIAFFMGVEQKDIDRWKKKVPQFAKPQTDGKNLAKTYLIAQGLRAAAGYDYVETNVKYKHKVLDDGTCVRYPDEVSEFHKHQPPNPQLLIFMLCNLSRQLDDDKDKWTSAHKIEVDKNEHLTITLNGAVASDQINKLAGKIIEVESRKRIESKVIDS